MDIVVGIGKDLDSTEGAHPWSVYIGCGLAEGAWPQLVYVGYGLPQGACSWSVYKDMGWLTPNSLFVFTRL